MRGLGLVRSSTVRNEGRRLLDPGLVVLWFASTQTSPRVLVLLVEDWVRQTTLGVFVGTFTDCPADFPVDGPQPAPMNQGVNTAVGR